MNCPFVFLYVFLGAVFLLVSAEMARAQPDAGLLLQEQRQRGADLPERFPTERGKQPVAPPMTDSGVTVLVKGFRFTGAEGLATEAELQELVRGGIGKESSFSVLQEMAETVTRYLREKKGYLLARAYLPKQDVTAGIIEIAILSGHIEGKARIIIKEPKRIKPSLLEGIAARALPGDRAVRMDRIERAVLLMNDLPGIDARASLERGETPGATRVVINAAEGPLLGGTLTADNYGDRYTGAYRGGAQARAMDPSGRGDQVSAGYTGAEHLNNWRASYAIPLGATGFSWNAAYTGLTYQLGKELSDLNAKGHADAVSTGVSYPLLRSRKASVWAAAGFEYTMLGDEANGMKTTDRKVPAQTASLSGSFLDTFGGGGLTSAYMAVTHGSVDLSGLAENRAADNAGPRTSGDFTRGAYFLARLQRLTRQAALYGSIRGQVASGNLDSSQKFILGGVTGVRAYPTGEGAADEGHALTVETRYDLPFAPAWAATQLVCFFDTGWVKLHNDPWAGSVTGATGKNDYVLSGGGLGINVGKAGRYSIRASYAHKIGPADGRSASGRDADGFTDDGRYWLQLIVWL